LTVFILLRRRSLDILVPALLVSLFVLVRAHGEAAFVMSSAGAVRSGDPNRPEVSLMVNVDWGEEYIPGMLDVFDEKAVKVTFFVCGRWARKNPDLLREMSRRGHEIGSHGELHKLATHLDDSALS
jgi:peptidoglycan/xylan/chitin deacetylase (PgdA/CDA1 family)